MNFNIVCNLFEKFDSDKGYIYVTDDGSVHVRFASDFKCFDKFCIKIISYFSDTYNVNTVIENISALIKNVIDTKDTEVEGAADTRDWFKMNKEIYRAYFKKREIQN